MRRFKHKSRSTGSLFLDGHRYLLVEGVLELPDHLASQFEQNPHWDELKKDTAAPESTVTDMAEPVVNEEIVTSASEEEVELDSKRTSYRRSRKRK